MENQEDGNPDHDLIARTISGDDRAFEQLFLDHGEEVWRLAFHLLQNHHDAEEAVQDTFVKAHRALSGFRGDCPFRTYLLSICRNRCRDALDNRSRRRTNEVSSDVPMTLSDGYAGLDEDQQEPYVAATPDPQAQWTTRLDLGAALAHLPQIEREAFVLVKVMQQTEHEAAHILAVPRTTVQARLGRARAKLAALLEGYQ